MSVRLCDDVAWVSVAAQIATPSVPAGVRLAIASATRTRFPLLLTEPPGSGLRGPMPKQECPIRALVRCDAVAGAGVVYRALGLPEC